MNPELKRKLRNAKGIGPTGREPPKRAEIWSLRADFSAPDTPMFLVDAAASFVRGWVLDYRLEMANAEDPIIASDRSPFVQPLRVHPTALVTPRKMMGTRLGTLNTEHFTSICASLAGHSNAWPRGSAYLEQRYEAERRLFCESLSTWQDSTQTHAESSPWRNRLSREVARVSTQVKDALADLLSVQPALGMTPGAFRATAADPIQFDLFTLSVGPWTCDVQVSPYRPDPTKVRIDIKPQSGRAIDGIWLTPIDGGSATILASDPQRIWRAPTPIPSGQYVLSLMNSSQIESVQLSLEA